MAHNYRKTSSAPRGQTIRTEFGRDDSSHDVPDSMGGKMGGGVTNVAHSLPGASAKQGGNASKEKKNRFD